MADRARVSVYFKSSPFGSQNHSHADQNSFVIYAQGRVMAMDSGYYDFYNSPHWRDWYKQTRAHNAITYDNGKGQTLGIDGKGTGEHGGAITQFRATPKYDLVTGDATKAYAGELALAQRTLLFIKPTTLVVIDQLKSGVPRRWEWNLHTRSVLDGGHPYYKVVTDGIAMCVQVNSPGVLSLQRTSGYQVKPQITTIEAAHHWTSFRYKSAELTGLFVSVIELNCDAPPKSKVNLTKEGGEIVINDLIVSISTGRVAVVLATGDNLH
jgi:hypothetical protein